MAEQVSGTERRDTPGYEEARDELVDVVRRLEAGGATLEDSLALWERGEELSRVCRRWLDGARARLDAALARDEEDGDGEEPRPEPSGAPGSSPAETPDPDEPTAD